MPQQLLTPADGRNWNHRLRQERLRADGGRRPRRQPSRESAISAAERARIDRRAEASGESDPRSQSESTTGRRLPRSNARPRSQSVVEKQLRQIYWQLEVVLEDEIAMLDQDRFYCGDYRWLGRREHRADPRGHRHQLGGEWNQHVGESGPVNVHRRQRIAYEEAAAARFLLLETVGECSQTRGDSLGRAFADFRRVAVFFPRYAEMPAGS